MSPSGGVTRNTLRRQISGALRDEVLAGRLPSGKEFTVKQIAEQYGVSATPVREALFDLTSQGLLVSDEHRGFQVRVFSAGDYRSIVQARSVIVEGVFSGCRPPAVRGEAMASVRRRASEASRAAKGGELDVLIGYDLRFWRELSAFVGNPHISEFLATLRVQGWVFLLHRLRTHPTSAERDRLLWLDHEALADAVTSEDRAAVLAMLRAYYAREVEWAEQLLAAERTPPADAPVSRD
ncbi:GntR family transcriptional regulator [Streptomyces sp. NBC_01218]|uniref:GntR family transcriptional regulator n=1 Tax=unclassified Streptomyces TaxID=2593676 RepID=UPI0023B94385|nr:MULTISPECIES: GntR family transcriptional regulator [unclassified Streptomyces]WEH40534.1 GntR family transcriptional regulator [Streptomyces sp. AM 2-1-1]WSQ52285.1 GntR family transcriptional regulator [Streptomyces sp. NBC_01218]